MKEKRQQQSSAMTHNSSSQTKDTHERISLFIKELIPKKSI